MFVSVPYWGVFPLNKSHLPNVSESILRQFHCAYSSHCDIFTSGYGDLQWAPYCHQGTGRVQGYSCISW